LSGPAFDSIKSAAEERQIPVFIITGINSKSAYLNLVGKGLCNIITYPVLEKKFLERVSDFNSCCSENTDKTKTMPLSFNCGQEKLNIEIEEKK
jgi:hypothetical protein